MQTKDVTLSFWVRSSVTGTHGGNFSNATDRSYPYTYTISSADTWENKTITLDGDTSGTWTTTNGVGIRFIGAWVREPVHQEPQMLGVAAEIIVPLLAQFNLSARLLLLGTSPASSLRSANRPRRLSIGRVAMSCLNVIGIVMCGMLYKPMTLSPT